MSKEIYHSSTLGPIPLSFMGRHLLQSLREAVTDLQAAAANGKPVDYKAVSLARGRLAQYISRLEEQPERPRAYEARLNTTTREGLFEREQRLSKFVKLLDEYGEALLQRERLYRVLDEQGNATREERYYKARQAIVEAIVNS